MATVSQLTKKPRVKPRRRSSAPALRKNPQRRAVCVRVFETNPRKPNSAKRKVARVKFTIKRYKIREHKITIAIPGGKGHGLQKFSKVLVRGGNPMDIPGARYRAMAGKLDLKPAFDRKTRRSKFGIKNPKKLQKLIDEYNKNIARYRS